MKQNPEKKLHLLAHLYKATEIKLSKVSCRSTTDWTKETSTPILSNTVAYTSMCLSRVQVWTICIVLTWIMRSVLIETIRVVSTRAHQLDSSIQRTLRGESA